MSIRLCPFLTSFLATPLQLQKHRIANWIWRSTSGTIVLKVRGGNKLASEKFLTATMLKVYFCGPPQVKAGKGAHKAEGLTKVNGGPLQFMSPFTCFASVWSKL